MIRTVIIDDEDLVRRGLAMLVEDAEGMCVVGEAADGRAGLDVIAREKPDVVLLDLRMPVMNGIEVLRALDGGPAVIVLTAFDTDEFVRDALQAGAVGFLVKTSAPDVLVDAIISAHEGRSMLSPGVLGKLFTPQPTGMDLLSARERDVAKLIAEGYSNPDIAARLYITLTTVKTHVARIMEKLGVEKRVQIALAVTSRR